MIDAWLGHYWAAIVLVVVTLLLARAYVRMFNQR